MELSRSNLALCSSVKIQECQMQKINRSNSLLKKPCALSLKYNEGTYHLRIYPTRNKTPFNKIQTTKFQIIDYISFIEKTKVEITTKKTRKKRTKPWIGFRISLRKLRNLRMIKFLVRT